MIILKFKFISVECFIRESHYLSLTTLELNDPLIIKLINTVNIFNFHSTQLVQL